MISKTILRICRSFYNSRLDLIKKEDAANDDPIIRPDIFTFVDSLTRNIQSFRQDYEEVNEI